MLVSNIDKKKPGKKNVIVLTKMHDTVKVTNGERKKPKDMWCMTTFAFILDTCRSNAKAILKDNGYQFTNF